jgi:outer membrane protein OmpA-like peptidoglycan-associated protein
MIRRLLATLMVGLFITTLVPDLASAQGIRPEKTVYLIPRVGMNWYLGDNEKSPFNMNLDAWKSNQSPPWEAGLELGYQISPTLSIGLLGQMTNHPIIWVYGPKTVDNVGDTGISFAGLFRWMPAGNTARVAPFLAFGLHTMDLIDGQRGFGPTAGLGLDIVLSDRISLIAEHNTMVIFPDKAADNSDSNGFGPADYISTLTLGLKFSFKSAFTPVEITSMDCPANLRVGETGNFATAANPDATQPVSYSWAFGDGSTASGMSASKSWNAPGSYTVTATANNGRSTSTSSCTVAVTALPPEIVTMSASSTTFDVCEPRTVNFTSNVRGENVTYRWDFGDGSTGTGANPSHTYSQAGAYTVTLTITNDGGSTSRSLTITAEPCTSVCFEIEEMNSVYFARNSSTLTAEARAALQENLDILLECPNLNARIEGYAAPGERNPQQLSEDRARAVEKFYTDNGVAASRLMTSGKGRVGGTTSKKEGASQYRRVDTIPVR